MSGYAPEPGTCDVRSTSAIEIDGVSGTLTQKCLADAEWWAGNDALEAAIVAYGRGYTLFFMSHGDFENQRRLFERVGTARALHRQLGGLCPGLDGRFRRALRVRRDLLPPVEIPPGRSSYEHRTDTATGREEGVMGDFALLYSGGSMPETEEETARVMKAWSDWYAELGKAIKDGGNPFGAAKTIGSDGSVKDGSTGSPHTGYTILSAESLDRAAELAKGSPVLLGGGTVTVYEIVEVM